MREIKFRAYDGIRKMWVAEFPSIIADKNDGMPTWQYMTGGALQITQYTGLKDKNGKEIYEGDIIEQLDKAYEEGHSQKKGFIVYCGGNFRICFNRRADLEIQLDGEEVRGDLDALWWLRGIKESKFTDEVMGEIIGNIYENKELLK